MKAALLLVDLQNDYLDAPTLVPERCMVVERAARLLQGCRSLGLPVVHVWTTVHTAKDNRMPHWQRLEKWLCVEGTPGHRPPAALQPWADEATVHKTFFSAFSSAALWPLLQRLAVDTVVVAGIHLHGCVRATVLDAYAQGLRVLVALDATATDDGLHGAITHLYLHQRAAEVASVEALLTLLGNTSHQPLWHCSPRRLDQRLFEVPIAGVAEVAQAAATARDAAGAWSGQAPSARAGVLGRLAEVLGGAHGLAEDMARDLGKPVSEGRGELAGTAAMLRDIAARVTRGYGSRRRRVRYRPHGVVGVITPWNNPWLIPLGKIAAALVYGNTVVWKPAPAASGVARQVMDCLRQAGCPAGVVNLLLGDATSAQHLMREPLVDAVALTGSSLAGYAAQAICGARRIPLQAELGGNNPAVVWADADLEHAATLIARGAFGQAGQRCTANRRAVVDRVCHDRFLALLRTAMRALPYGDPLAAETVVGPLVTAGQRDRVGTLVERCRSHVLEVDDRPAPPGGAYYPSTLLAVSTPDHEVVQQETFGPVLVLQPAENWEHALELANGVPQGLASALFSTSRTRQQRFLEQARAGILKINRATDGAEPQLPFGGWKGSGLGPPEHSTSDREFYTRTQTVYRD